MRSKTTGELMEELERERDEVKKRLVQAERTIDILRRQGAERRRKAEETSRSDDHVDHFTP